MSGNNSSNTPPSGRRASLYPPNTGNDQSSGSRRNSRAALEKLPPSLMRWEIVNRVLSFALKGDWPAVDQHLSMVGKNNLENLSELFFNEDEVIYIISYIEKYFINLYCFLFDNVIIEFLLSIVYYSEQNVWSETQNLLLFYQCFHILLQNNTDNSGVACKNSVVSFVLWEETRSDLSCGEKLIKRCSPTDIKLLFFLLFPRDVSVIASRGIFTLDNVKSFPAALSPTRMKARVYNSSNNVYITAIV